MSVDQEFWFSDVGDWGAELREANVVKRFVWTEKSLEQGIDYLDWMQTNFPREWESLVIDGVRAKWAAPGQGVEDVPVWIYDKKLRDLVSILMLKPKRVVIRIFDSNIKSVARAARELAELQQETQAILHVQDLHNSFPLMFGLNIGSTAGTLCHNYLTPPHGKSSAGSRGVLRPGDNKWAWILGLETHELAYPSKRIIFNARSMEYATRYWKSSFTPEWTQPPAWSGIDNVAGKVSTQIDRYNPATKGKDGDKVVCNSCSLSGSCRYYRVDSICTVPRSEMVQLAKFFNCRDADSVISGLSQMMQVGAERLERGLTIERDLDEIDPEVSKIFDSLFEKGVKLAKLMDPALNKPTTAVVVNNGGQQQIAMPTPKAMVAGVVRELESRGIPREQITPEMLQKVLGGPTTVPAAAVDVVVANQAPSDPRVGRW